MNCPICGREMEQGELRTSDAPGLFFMPLGTKLWKSLFVQKSKVEEQGGIVLDGPYVTSFHETAVPAQVCRSCKKIVIDY